MFPEKPPQHPELPEGWIYYPDEWHGIYSRKNSDGTFSKLLYSIGGISTPDYPSRALVHIDPHSTVTASVIRGHLHPDPMLDGLVAIETVLETHYADEPGYEWIRDVAMHHFNLSKWFCRYGGIGPAYGAYLTGCQNYSQTSYEEIEGNYLYLTFSVKWFLRENALKFCAHASRLHREFKRRKIDVRIMRG